jgi:mono/diheme cytochrome c family protein
MKNKSSLLAAALMSLGAFGFVGCDETLRQDMANQPRQNPLSPAAIFPDGRSERPIIDNTVARGSVEDDALFVAKDSNAFPLALTQELLARGQDRYNIFCSPCHGLQGDGQGMVTMRGMKHPPTYHQERLRNEPNGYFFDVITNGFGAMNGYSAQLNPRDRWAIVAYVRALQLSRNAHVAALPANLKDKLMAGGTAQ